MNRENTQAIQEGSFSVCPIEGGGVTSAKGFKASGVHAGFRANPHRLDLALVVADEPCATAAVFTQNVFCAAPVQFCKQQLRESSGTPSYGTARAVVINSGNANAATGTPGLEAAEAESKIAADALGCPQGEVLIASTGVIGVPLPIMPFEQGIPEAFRALSISGGADAARAIMTTDTYAKERAVTCTATDAGGSQATFTVGGMAKGSGMIMPNMATMIAVLTTDAPIGEADLFAALKEAVGISFNKVTVDSDTSTNDTCICLASGAADTTANASASSASADPATPVDFSQGSLFFLAFKQALETVCIGLARDMAIDGEGATKLVTVNVDGAATDEDADKAARTVANSPLVKTAIAGRDANWGRIAAALGRSGARFDQTNVDIDIMGIPVCRAGLTQEFDEVEALKRFEDPEIEIDVHLGAGDASATVWTCDLTHDYISINADYRS